MKALSVFSGGLDSMLAAALIRAQDVDVQALFFETPFFGAKRAIHSARVMDLPLKVVDITQRHLEVVKHPEHGYGGNMNPCIDCHALMVRIAGEMLESEGAGFVVTGEVLGQRPMSQNKQSLAVVASQSGLGPLLLRPLSAKLLPETLPEERGWVRRDLLMDIRGRSRKPQMALAEHFNITDYPSPAGGCLLTEEVFSRRLRDLFASEMDATPRQIELLKLGRHFRLSPGGKVVVGRNKGENDKLLRMSRPEDVLLRPLSVPGPTGVLCTNRVTGDVNRAAAVVAAYSDAPEGRRLAVTAAGGGVDKELSVAVRDKAGFRGWMV